MSELPIVKVPEPGLRKTAEPLTDFGPETQQLIDDMIETLRTADGVGLAAPQIGRSIQLAIIETVPDYDDDGNEIEGSRDLFVVANPEILWASADVVDGIEGCLSIPGYVGEVERAESILVRARDRHGKKLRLQLEDWTARIFQHEIDHLNGILYLDRLTSPENIWTDEEFEQIRKEQKEEQDNEPVVGD